MLDDTYETIEPILVLSGLTYLFPLYVAVRNKNNYDMFTYGLLTFTTIWFHITLYEVLFILDCFAIINCLLRIYYISRKATRIYYLIFVCSVIYSLISYFIGKLYNIMSFHPNWNTQIAYHSVIHLTTSYESYLLINSYYDHLPQYTM
jgi:hypothetical protein